MQYEPSYFKAKFNKYGNFISNIAKMNAVNIKMTLEEYDLQNVQEEKNSIDINLLTVKNKFIEYYDDNTLNITNLLNQITYNAHFWIIINSIKWPDRNECDVLPSNVINYYNLRQFTINKIFIKKEIIKYESLLEIVVTRILENTQFILSPINVKNLVYHIIFKGSDIYKLILKNRNIDNSYIDFYIYQYHNAYEILNSL